MGVGFAVGTGRCGTKFLAELFAHDRDVASHHERHPFNDTFHRYCEWYNIPVDPAGFLAVKRRGIEADLRIKRYSFEASAFLCLAIPLLHQAFGARIVVMIRAPDRVVASYLRKGWYAAEPALDNPDNPPTMQDVAMPHHFLGRTMPRGEEFVRWRALSRVGRIAWYWSCINGRLLETCARMPSGSTRIQKLEELDYVAFERLREFLGAPDNIAEAEFNATRRRRPNAASGLRSVHEWTDAEREEFEQEVGGLASELGYVWSTEELRQGTPDRARSSLKPRIRAMHRRFFAQQDKHA